MYRGYYVYRLCYYVIMYIGYFIFGILTLSHYSQNDSVYSIFILSNKMHVVYSYFLCGEAGTSFINYILFYYFIYNIFTVEFDAKIL